MTAALEGGEWSAARPGRTLPPRKTRYPFYRRLGGPQGRSGRAENLVPTGIRSRTVQPLVAIPTELPGLHYGQITTQNWITAPTLLEIPLVNITQAICSRKMDWWNIYLLCSKWMQCAQGKHRQEMNLNWNICMLNSFNSYVTDLTGINRR